MSTCKNRRKRRKKQAIINQRLKRDLFKDINISPCCYCKYVFLIDNLTIEHIVPLLNNGTNDPENIALACAPCNQEKGRESWMKKYKGIRL